MGLQVGPEQGIVLPVEGFYILKLACAWDLKLLAASASTSVTSVALENGFLHLPRFSSYYRAAFGEAPVATLRRNRRKASFQMRNSL